MANYKKSIHLIDRLMVISRFSILLLIIDKGERKMKERGSLDVLCVNR